MLLGQGAEVLKDSRQSCALRLGQRAGVLRGLSSSRSVRSESGLVGTSLMRMLHVSLDGMGTCFGVAIVAL